MRFVKGVLALATLVAVVIGMPAAIAIFGQLPDLSRWAGRSPLDVLLSRDDGTLLINVLTIGAWLAWGVFTACVLLELAAVVSRQRFRPRLPGLKIPQAVAAGLIVAVIAMFVVQAALPRGTAPSSPPPAPAAAVTQTQTSAMAGAGGDHAIQRVDHADRTEQTETSLHTVTAGEDLWSIAEQHYGDGSQWRTIAAANAVLLKHGPDDLRIGWQLVIPGAEEDAAGVRVVVQKGDSLSSLAAEHLGSSSRWKVLYEENRAVIADPDVIDVGTVLVLPEVAETSDTADEGELAGDPRSDRYEGGEGSTPDTPAEEGQLDGDPRTQGPQGGGGVAPLPQTAADSSEVEQVEQTDAVDPALLAPGVGGLLAAGALTGIAGRRLWQLRQRPVGRRLPQAPTWAAGVERSLGHQQDPVSLRAMDKAMRLIAEHCLRTGADLPRLLSATVGPGGVELEMSRAGLSAPAPFAVGGRVWVASVAAVMEAGEVDAVRPWPALVSLGTRHDGSYLLVNLEELSVMDVQADDEMARGIQSAVAMELAMSLWAEELQVVLVGGADRGEDTAWVEALDVPHVHLCPTVAQALQHVEQRAGQQRTALAGAAWFGPQRLDPTTAEAWAPEVFVFLDELSSVDSGKLQRILRESPVSMAAVTRDGEQLVGGPAGGARLEATTELALLKPAGVQFTPQYVDTEFRSSVKELLAITGTDRTTAAPWWAAESEPENAVPSDSKESVEWPNVPDADGPVTREEHAVFSTRTASPPEAGHPVVRLIGPIELVGVRGTAPSRAAKQCIEYAAFLLEHPGSTAPAMKSSLIIAEGTRRSNMSRLRAWLGEGPSGPYLPDAYSGRISLDDAVSSDWQHLQMLVAAGVNRTPTSALTAALELVRGAPLADAAPQQWQWAEEMRTDMVSVIRDIGVELCRRALDEREVDLARWAAARALAGAPGDEFLMCARIRTEHLAGNAADVQRLALQVSSQARRLGVDLSDETVSLLQQVIEGSVRARSI